MTSIFNTSREYPKMHVWSKFGDSSSNLWRVIVRTDVWTDGRTDGHTQATTIPLRPERPRGKNWPIVKNDPYKSLCTWQQSNDIFSMSRQHCCRGVWKILLWLIVYKKHIFIVLCFVLFFFYKSTINLMLWKHSSVIFSSQYVACTKFIQISDIYICILWNYPMNCNNKNSTASSPLIGQALSVDISTNCSDDWSQTW